MSQNPQTNTEADKMLDVYIHDYLVKRKLDASSKAFQDEAKLSTNVTAIDAPRSFLYEWWAVFWDTFIARYKPQDPGPAESCIETQTNSAQQQQQQQSAEYQCPSGTENDVSVEQNPLAATASASKMYKEMVKFSLLKHLSNDSAVQESSGINVRRPLDPIRSICLPPTKYQRQTWKQDIKSSMGLLNPGGAVSDAAVIGAHGSGRALNSMPLSGWPLMGLNQIRAGFCQQQRSLMQYSQLPRHLQFLLQAQQNLTSSSTTELNRREPGLDFIPNFQNMGFNKADLLNFDNRPILNDGLRVPIGLPLLLAKQQQGTCDYSRRESYHHETHHPNYTLHQQDKQLCTSSIEVNASLLNTSQGDDQASDNRAGRKKKQRMSSSCLGSNSRTVKAASLSQSSEPSTPSAHTTEDISSMPSLLDANDSPKNMHMIGDTCAGILKAVEDHSMHMYHFEDDGFLDYKNESLLSHDGPDCDMDDALGFTFSEIANIHASTVDCCHFSWDGKLLATGGQDKKARLWCMDSLEHNATFEHPRPITDIRFSPTMPQMATSSLDKTVRIWDVDNVIFMEPRHSLRIFTGHPSSVMSLDFHPRKEDLICSCDGHSQISYWNIKNGLCTRFTKVGANQVRFQPKIGAYLAAVVGDAVSILDSEISQTCRNLLKGHTSNMKSICWDMSGEHLATISEEFIRVWRIGAGEEERCIHELSINGKRFHCAAFHPCYPSVLIIGCHQSLELWNMAENKMLTPLEQPVGALAVSEPSSLIASAGHDNLVKLWK